ncbi:hypothetical protein [Croceicoccus naphthovorans]|nr:hypothetical protein [Croceicoccus naphthovorans]MBB3990858.1 hypothetical protein [Croceicoccus naphthovorans]
MNFGGHASAKAGVIDSQTATGSQSLTLSGAGITPRFMMLAETMLSVT